MMKAFFHFVTMIFLMLGLLVSCGNESEKIDENNEAHKLLNEAGGLKEALTRGRIFVATSARDKIGIEGALQEARFALIRLGKDPNDKIGIELGLRSLREIEKYIITRGERAVIENFYTKFSNLVTDAARQNGISVSGIDWRQFIYNFSDGIAPFATLGTSSEWATGISLDESYVRVRGPQNKAWLISPSFDLRGVLNPSFRIVHQTNVDRDDRISQEFNRVLINSRVFRAYVSIDYQDGDVNKATWTEVNLGKLPSSIDFHTVESDKVDLSPFISENTTVALVLDADPKIVGRHYLTWQIYRFEIFALGDLGEVKARPGVLHEHLFNKKELAPFHEVMTALESPRWAPFEIGGNFKFAKIEAIGKIGENWLISPKYMLNNLENVKLTIKEVVRNPDFAKMNILISSDYNGADPNASTWTEIKRGDFTTTPDKWEDITTGPYDLSAFLGKEIVVAFKFKSDAGDKIGWEVGALNFIGKGENIKVKRYPLEFKLPGGDDDSDDANAPVFVKSFDFSLGQNDFIQEIVSGTPAAFNLKSRNNGPSYVNISGNTQKNTGTVRFISPKFPYDSGLGLSIKQAINFYPEIARTKKMIKILLSDDTKEVELNFKKVPTGANWTIVESEIYEIPKEFAAASELKIILEYSSGEDDIFPNWDIHKIDIFKLKQ